MSKHEKVTFSNQRIVLDGNDYNYCHFEGCTMVYGATEGKIGLNGCSFNGCKWEFEGAALRTLRFLSALYQIDGMKDFIETTFENIRRGPQ